MNNKWHKQHNLKPAPTRPVPQQLGSNRKSKEKKMTLDELIKKIVAIIPNAEFDEDNDGQIVIYTSLEEDARGNLREYEGEVEYPDNESNCQYHDKG